MARRAFGDEGPDLDLNFDAIEAVAFQAAQAVIKGTIQQSLSQQMRKLGETQPCPHADESVPWRPNYGNSSYAVYGAVRRAEVPLADMSRDFFPLRPALRLDGHGFSPSVLRKIVIAGGSHPSFGLAAKMLANWRRSQSVLSGGSNH